MLRSDGLSREQFMPLWRDAMWHAVDPDERARLVLEMGRIAVREGQTAETVLVAYADGRDPPLTVFALPDAPARTGDAALRQATRERLAELGASEAYVLLTLQSRAPDGTVRYVLTSWAETLDGDESVWMQAYRHASGQVEMAPAVNAPEPALTEVSRQLKGLLSHAH